MEKLMIDEMEKAIYYDCECIQHGADELFITVSEDSMVHVAAIVISNHYEEGNSPTVEEACKEILKKMNQKGLNAETTIVEFSGYDNNNHMADFIAIWNPADVGEFDAGIYVITDCLLTELWNSLSNVPVSENGVYIEENFFIWNKGEEKEKIWKWFDERHFNGLAKGLMNLD